MRTLLCTLLLLLGVGTASAQEFTYNDHLYTLVSGDWNSAQQSALDWGGNLVTINDAAEESWLKATFGTSSLFWIGLTDRQSEGVWQWVSGEAVTYTNWAPRQPDNFLAWLGGEDYAVMNWGSSKKWNDSWPVLTASKGIAERVVPEPFSYLLFGTGGVALFLMRRKRQA